MSFLSEGLVRKALLVDWDMSPTDGSNVEANLRGLLELGKMDSIFINILVSSAPSEVPPLERLTKTGTMTKHAFEDDLHGSDDTTRKLNMNTEFKIGDEFVKILHDNAFNRIDGGDVIDHTSKVLEILEWIKIPNVEKNQLRLHVFPISLSGHAREWWDNEIKGSVTTWNELKGDGIYNFEESNQYSPQIPVPAECDIMDPAEFTVV
ncbi:hypothetical protein Tco_0336127 [Tanacetum coccineum]